MLRQGLADLRADANQRDLGRRRFFACNRRRCVVRESQPKMEQHVARIVRDDVPAAQDAVAKQEQFQRVGDVWAGGKEDRLRLVLDGDFTSVPCVNIC